MTRLVIVAPHDYGASLASDAERHGHLVIARYRYPADLVLALAQHSPDAALIAGDGDLVSAELLSAADAAGVRVVALASGVAQRRQVAGLGLREIADAGAPWREVERLIVGAGSAAASVEAAAGSVLAVWGPSGAPGRTTVAVTLAAELAALGHRVMLADADTHGAAIAPVLGLSDEAPGFGAACRLAATDALTPAELDRVAQYYESRAGSFRVLTGISRSSRWPELRAERVEATLVVCRAAADVVVVDVASDLATDSESGRNAATLTTLAAADRIIGVGSADPIGLSRFLRTHPDLLDAVTGEVDVVMNRVRASAIGLGARDQVASALLRFAGVRDVTMIPDDRAAFDSAVLAGRTITDVAPRSAARLALRDLATMLAPPVPAPRVRRRDLRGAQPSPPTTR